MKKTARFTLSKFLILLWINAGTSSFSFFTPIVTTQQGRVRGLRSLLGQNRYYSIPYAVAERFQLPRDPPNWDGIYNAFNPVKRCAQSIFSFTTGHENCLDLDVYTPESVKSTYKLPVMVFIHGGAYYYGEKTLYNPEFLVTKNVIVVTINYRLGVFGFLCVNDVSNLGLRDQVAALQWVQRNIAAFGGDPDNVTLCGQSAGAAAVSMHFLSKVSKGLFHKAILMSGSALTPWAFNLDPVSPALEDARKIGDACNENDIYNIFRKMPLEDLVEATRDNSVNMKYFKYSPCLDINSTNPFFHDKPYNIMTSGSFTKVPTMIGYTDAEGITFHALSEADTFAQFDKHFNERISSVFFWCSDEDRRKIGKITRSHYFGRKSITEKSVREYINYFSDWVAIGTTDAYSKLLTRVSGQPVFTYQFSYTGDRNFLKIYSGLAIPGAAHADDMFYIFKPAGLPLLLSKSDELIINRATTIFTNFMKYGNPIPKRNKLLPVLWPPASTNATNTMRLDLNLAIVENPQENFFQNILCEYGESGHVPCDSAEKCTRKNRTTDYQCDSID